MKALPGFILRWPNPSRPTKPSTIDSDMFPPGCGVFWFYCVTSTAILRFISLQRPGTCTCKDSTYTAGSTIVSVLNSSEGVAHIGLKKNNEQATESGKVLFDLNFSMMEWFSGDRFCCSEIAKSGFA